MVLKKLQLRPTTSGLTLTAADLDVEGVPLLSLRINLVSSSGDFYYDNIDVTPQKIPVGIDIKPGSDPNSINLGSNGVVPVAILSSAEFDATTVDPGTVELAGAGVAVKGKGDKLHASVEDVNGDGLNDLSLKISTQNFVPESFQNGSAILTGVTFGGDSI